MMGMNMSRSGSSPEDEEFVVVACDLLDACVWRDRSSLSFRSVSSDVDGVVPDPSVSVGLVPHPSSSSSLEENRVVENPDCMGEMFPEPEHLIAATPIVLHMVIDSAGDFNTATNASDVHADVNDSRSAISIAVEPWQRMMLLVLSFPISPLVIVFLLCSILRARIVPDSIL